jgi:hypothetical protein
LYGYVLNNPLNFIDPYGLQEETFALVPYLVGLHWGRNSNNFSPVNENAATDAGWELLPPEKSIYHRMGPDNEDNKKYVSPDGQCEAVYDKNGNLVTNPENVGTYNFYPPNNGLGHFLADVLPYYFFGNSGYDTTTQLDMVTVTASYYLK